MQDDIKNIIIIHIWGSNLGLINPGLTLEFRLQELAWNITGTSEHHLEHQIITWNIKSITWNIKNITWNITWNINWNITLTQV